MNIDVSTIVAYQYRRLESLRCRVAHPQPRPTRRRRWQYHRTATARASITSPSQATILTGTEPAEHGIVANGWYFQDLALILNWQRSARLLTGETIWEAGRKIDPDIKSASLFWRYATHATCDVSVVERPTYWADGRKSPDIYTQPASIRDELVQQLGQFPLFNFWGPPQILRRLAGSWMPRCT